MFVWEQSDEHPNPRSYVCVGNGGVASSLLSVSPVPGVPGVPGSLCTALA